MSGAEKDLINANSRMIMKYFAYGSNMNPARMKKREVNFTSRQHAVLKKYSLQFNKMASKNPTKEGKGNIVSDVDEFVEGALYEIKSSDRDKLDEAEGYSDHYDRITVLVQVDDGKPVLAFTYIAQPHMVRDGLKPTREYLNHYLEAKDILSKRYYQKLESWSTLD